MDISLMNDLAFKYVFGAEEHAPRLKAFLNAVLHGEGFWDSGVPGFWWGIFYDIF